ncbi:hypothetical protein CFP56_005895 [Quercus suber]|uniref:Uncharacterized protein n=1 Tax=Quercus suber TaxID=58331 RepID=A0AAW0M9Q0_QUESU
MLSHDDKDCDLWLGSKGTLPTESQQFGHWIRASQFSPGRRQTIEVKGFERACTSRRHTRGLHCLHRARGRR